MTAPSRRPVMAGGRVRYQGHVYQLKKLTPATWTGATVIAVAVPGTVAVCQLFAERSYVSLGFAVCRRLWRAMSAARRRELIARIFERSPSRIGAVS